MPQGTGLNKSILRSFCDEPVRDACSSPGLSSSDCPPYLRVNLPQHIIEQLQELHGLQGVKRDQIVALPEGLLIELLNNELHLVTHGGGRGEPRRHGRR